MAAIAPSTPKDPALEAARARRRDNAGIAGIILAVPAGINLICGMGIPLIPWILAGFFAVPLIILGLIARPPLRKPVLAMGLLSLIPVVILALVEVLPGLMHRST